MRIRDPTAGVRSARRRRFTMAAAVGAAFTMTSGSIAFGEPLIGTGQSADGTLVAVATTGDARSSQGLALSGAGTAYSAPGGVGVSALGRADGTGTNISGEAFLLNTGILDGPVTAAQAQVPLTDTLDPVGTANKLASAAQAAPQVAQNLATGLTQMPLSGPTSASSTSSSRPPMALTINQPMFAQERWYYCLPASVQMFLASAGVSSPTQDQLAGRLGTKHPEGGSAGRPTSGTPARNAVAVINRIRTQGDRLIWHQIDSPNTLMTYITEDVYRYRHASILPLNPSRLKSWSGRGTRHGVVAHGYDHRQGGKIYIMDPYDYTRFNWTEAKWGGPNPGGSHTPDLGSVYAAVKATGSYIIW